MIRRILAEIYFRLEMCIFALLTAVLVLFSPHKVEEWLIEWLERDVEEVEIGSMDDPI